MLCVLAAGILFEGGVYFARSSRLCGYYLRAASDRRNTVLLHCQQRRYSVVQSHCGLRSCLTYKWRLILKSVYFKLLGCLQLLMSPPVTLGKLSASSPLTVGARQLTLASWVSLRLAFYTRSLLKVCRPQKYWVEYHHNWRQYIKVQQPLERFTLSSLALQ